MIKGVGKISKNEAKEQKGGFLSILLSTLRASLLGNILTAKTPGRRVIRAGERTIRAGQDFQCSPIF